MAARRSKPRRCRNHDYIERLYIEYYDRIYAYVAKRVAQIYSNRELVQDITNQVFLRAMEADLKGMGAHSSESGWLYRIAHNAVIDHYRARDARDSKNISLETLDWVRGLDRGVPAPDIGSHVDAEKALVYAFRHLTDEQFQVVEMWATGYKFAEIARIMDKSEGAIKALLHRARVAIKPMLHRMTDMERHQWTPLREAA